MTFAVPRRHKWVVALLALAEVTTKLRHEEDTRGRFVNKWKWITKYRKGMSACCAVAMSIPLYQSLQAGKRFNQP